MDGCSPNIQTRTSSLLFAIKPLFIKFLVHTSSPLMTLPPALQHKGNVLNKIQMWHRLQTTSCSNWHIFCNFWILWSSLCSHWLTHPLKIIASLLLADTVCLCHKNSCSRLSSTQKNLSVRARCEPHLERLCCVAKSGQDVDTDGWEWWLVSGV